MTEHPIIFSDEMIRAILSDTKTQTRRVIKPQFTTWIQCPYGKPGDFLWVREAWNYITKAENEHFDTRRADGCPVEMLYRLFSKLFEHFVADGMIDLDYGDFQEWAGEAGLLEPVNYDPAQHGELDAEPGDIIYVLTPTARAAMDAAERTEP